jgi:photosystem II stability/assembly factor-like uncharacterized protein
MKSALILFVMILASLLTPVNGQWVDAYQTNGSFHSFYFTDTLHGWFTHDGLNNYSVVRTTDGGHTFTEQQTQNGTYSLVAIYMEDNQNGWTAGSNEGSGPGHIFRTTDGGDTWMYVSHPASQSLWEEIVPVGQSLWFIGHTGGYPEYYNYTLLMKTSDNGGTWSLTQYDQFIRGRGLVVFDSLNFIMYGGVGLQGTSCFMVRTSDGGNTWISANLPANCQVENVKFWDSNVGYALITDFTTFSGRGYLYKTTDSGFTWNEWYDYGPESSQKWGLSLILGTSTIFVAGWLRVVEPYLFGILRSNDAGVTWDTVMQENTGIPSSIYTPDAQHGWAVSHDIYRYDYQPPVNHNPYFLTTDPLDTAIVGQIYNVTLQATDPDNDTLSFDLLAKPDFLTFSVGQLTTIYECHLVGTPSVNDTGNVPISIRVTDGRGGADTLSWILHVVMSTPVELTSFTASPNSNNVVLSWTTATETNNKGFGIERSTNQGYISLGFVQGQGTSTQPHSYSFVDNKVPPGTYTYRLKQVDYDGSYAYSPEVTVTLTGPTTYALEQNYPNPFNPTTTIKYSIPQTSEVSLKVYNLLGQEVATLVRDSQGPGNYTLRYDCQRLSAGVYLYRLTAGTFNQTKKMILMK